MMIFLLFEKPETMLKNIFFIFWILFQSFAEIYCQMVPIARYHHTATLINNKLYILGGLSNGKSALALDEIVGKEFFYLDVSVPFNTQSLSWQDLSSVNNVPSHYGAASVNGGANNNTLFLYGGTNDTAALVYTFDPQSNIWNAPTISGASVTRKEDLTGIIDNKGKMYLWGGMDSNNLQYQNDMLILDTINLNWGKGNLVGAPTSRFSYGATLLPNQKIIYIGE